MWGEGRRAGEFEAGGTGRWAHKPFICIYLNLMVGAQSGIYRWNLALIRRFAICTGLQQCVL